MCMRGLFFLVFIALALSGCGSGDAVPSEAMVVPDEFRACLARDGFGIDEDFLREDQVAVLGVEGADKSMAIVGIAATLDQVPAMRHELEEILEVQREQLDPHGVVEPILSQGRFVAGWVNRPSANDLEGLRQCIEGLE
jgi:hypothetical protein